MYERLKAYRLCGPCPFPQLFKTAGMNIFYVSSNPEKFRKKSKGCSFSFAFKFFPQFFALTASLQFKCTAN